MDFILKHPLQELTAVKEEKVEWKNRSFLLAKEKSIIDLKLNSKEAQEKAFIAQLDHLKTQVNELKVTQFAYCRQIISIF